jgi:hypothetical protein
MITKPPMKRLTLAASIFFLFFSAAAQGQSVARVNATQNASTADDAARVINSLKRLQQEVIVYRSLGEFEEGRKLARVPLRTFEAELTEVTGEVENILVHLPPGKLKIQITNSLACFRDGVFWWRQIDEPRVISASALIGSDRTRTSSDKAFLATIPYTVAIHWRQAAKYLNRANELIATP